ncbi:hypothetical protein [Mesorhizobium sp. GR13]|uniref:hypothetical protein n=1 Tax=Mesorhizobium sp. GR13 TaxID=2562308 RepID=UPI0010C056E8|nr:hypothetical protein [Mesorhizobium sp. GR13]
MLLYLTHAHRAVQFRYARHFVSSFYPAVRIAAAYTSAKMVNGLFEEVAKIGEASVMYQAILSIVAMRQCGA